MGDAKTVKHGLAIGEKAQIRGSKGLVSTPHLLGLHVHVSQTAAYVAHLLNSIIDLGVLGEQNTQIQLRLILFLQETYGLFNSRSIIGIKGIFNPYASLRLLSRDTHIFESLDQLI